MDVAVVGLGYVGAVTSACLAEMGHTVVGVDVDRQKVDEIEAGRSPIVEPRLEELVAAGRKSDRLRVTTDLAAPSARATSSSSASARRPGVTER